LNSSILKSLLHQAANLKIFYRQEQMGE